MARFLLLLSPEPLAGGEWSAADLGARTARFVAWVEALREGGALRDGARLGARSGRLLRERGGARREVAAGAPLAHYFVIDARDWDAALALASRCPGAEPGTIDVYRLDDRAQLSAVASP